jgi:carboxymethylenebutenolidase
MKEAFAQVATPEGVMRAFTTHPEEGGPFPAVVIFMDVWGLREELYEIARRVATVGYYAVVPDFYYRFGNIAFDFRDADNKVISVARLPEENRALVEGTLAKLSNGMVVSDTGALLHYLASQQKVRRGEKGAIGYCMGGRHAFCAATQYPEEFGAVAALHGTALISKRPESPHLRIGELRGEVYCGFGERDPHTERPLVAELAELMHRARVRYRYEVHAGAEHGYALPSRDVYDSRAAARDWELIFSMFDRRIPAHGRPVPA